MESFKTQNKSTITSSSLLYQCYDNCPLFWSSRMRSKLAVTGEFAIQIHMFNKRAREPHQQQLFPGLFIATHLVSNFYYEM